MNDSTSVGKRVQNLQIGPEFDTYTMVIIHAGQTTDAQGNTTDLDYIAGNTSGRTLEITDPMGTQAKANALLAKLQNSKWQYQPYVGDKALLDPAAELGDGITISDTFSAVYRRKVHYSPLMATDIEAPSDEEIDHEYPYVPKEERVYKRESQFTRSQLKINANEISAEVARVDQDVFNPNNANSVVSKISVQAGRITSEINRATTAEGNLSTRITQTDTAITTEVDRAKKEEGNLSSRITQNATDITARVTKTGGTNSSFAWSLQSNNFSLIAGNKTVFKCTSSGIEIDGKITARTGYIGNGTSGFTITNTSIYNGVTSISDTTHDGVYIGTNGIRLGKGVFSVNKSGRVDASNLNITGGSISIKNGNTETFKVTSSGAVTAKDLTIAGGSIDLKDSSGNVAFRVTTGGDVTARNMTLRGTLKLQNADGGNTQYINADTLAQYASRGNSARSWIDADVPFGESTIKRETYLSNGASSGYSANGWINEDLGSGYTRGAYCVDGAGGGIAFNRATNPDIGAYPAWFGCQNLQVNPYGGGHLWVGDTMFTPEYVQDIGIILVGQSM